MNSKAIFIFILLSCITSCKDCEKEIVIRRQDECLLIVEKKPSVYDKYFNFRGRSPLNGKKCDCQSESSYRWWELYIDKIEIGDTIMKKKGELIFSIHKKDTILNFNWECDGKTYE